MLNYISAELYKLRHKKSIFITVGLILVLESTLLLPGYWKALRGDQVGILLGFMVLMMPIGLLLAPVFAAVTFDDQHGHSTLKNEVVFGIPRGRIYLGKLCAAMLAGTLAAAAVVGWYLVLTWFLAKDLFSDVPGEVWTCVWSVLAGSWLSWLAAVAFTFFLLFTLKSAGGAMAVVYLLTCFGFPLCMIGYEDPGHFDIFYWFSKFFYIAPYRNIILAPDIVAEGLPWPLLRVLGETAALCLGWVAGSSALGLALFRRREVK